MERKRERLKKKGTDRRSAGVCVCGWGGGWAVEDDDGGQWRLRASGGAVICM